jgi:pyruvate dehydrogenase E2 component (dihydrolipoamide acetyltransferase)
LLKAIPLAAALAALIPATAPAQAAAPPDAAAAAPTLTYRSVFQDLPTGVEEGGLDWKKANADVAGFPRGHADWLKLEEQPGSAAPAPAAGPASAAAPAAPAAAPAPPVRPGHRH